MIPLGPVVARSRLRAARTAAWMYLADADRRAEWWPELRLDPRVGGEIVERWSEEIEDELVSRDASGTVDVWVDGHAIGFTWREAGDFRDTAVLLTLRSQGQETGITITETGFDALPDAADRAAASQDGWQVLLRDLTTAIDNAVAAGLLPTELVVEPASAAVAPVVQEAEVEAAPAAVVEEHELAVDPDTAVDPDADLDADAEADAAAGSDADAESDAAAGLDAVAESDSEAELGTAAESDADAVAEESADAVAAETADAANAETPDAANDANVADENSADVPDTSQAPASDADADDTEDHSDLDFDALIRGDGSDPDDRK